MPARLDAILTTLTQKHAKAVLHRAPTGAERLSFLAQTLSKQGVLVLWADIPTSYQTQQADLINDWVSTYGNFYRLLTDALFPSLKTIQAVYADNDYPPVVVLEAHCIPVIEAFANIVVPYVASHQHVQMANMAELQGVLNFIMEDLEGLDVTPVVFRNVVSQGVQYMAHLMGLPLQQRTLTEFSRQHYQRLAPFPPEPPEIPQRATSPAPEPVSPRLSDTQPMQTALPETPTPPMDEKALFSSSIPIFFDRRDKADKPKRKPPVPTLRKRDP